MAMENESFQWRDRKEEEEEEGDNLLGKKE
jgi:hypothetical protein